MGLLLLGIVIFAFGIIGGFWRISFKQLKCTLDDGGLSLPLYRVPGACLRAVVAG